MGYLFYPPPPESPTQAPAGTGNKQFVCDGRHQYLDVEAHSAAGGNDERLVDLFSAHGRVQRAQEELE